MKLLGFDLFLSRGLYGSRPASHVDAYRAQPGWYFIVWGSWTLEVETPAQFGRAAKLAALAVGVAVPTLAIALI